MNQRTETKRQAAGFSLIEMLLASAIFGIVAAVAFIFYTAAQKSYKAGENFTDQQQATRVAFDRMVADLRLAGFNTNPDGDTSRVDEQVEGAWDTAVAIRGDFDFEDPAASVTPESALPGSVYNVVSTGNDEIVTYVLAKPGPSGPDTLTLRLDTDKPRTKSVKLVTIPNVAVVQNNPPYTLYRVSLADVNGAYPSSPQASSAFVFEPVADNIRSLNFQYWPDSGAMLGPNTPANAGDDIGGLDANSLTRSRIRRITVNLVGMTPDEDMDYVDASDASATTHYRKLDLQSDVNAENLGKTAVKDIDVTPPPAPANVGLVPGHCQGLLVTWDQPSTASGVTSYVVKYWPNGSPSSFATTSVTYPHNEYGVIDYDGHGFVAGLTSGVSYCVQVQAKDLQGNQSGWSPSSSPPCATVTEASTPAQPQNLAATGNGTLSPLDSQIVLTWNEVKSNSNTVAGDPDVIGGTTILRDPKGYKLYRDTVSTFTPNDSANLVAGTSVLGPGVVTYTDSGVANCQTYYYKLVATDTCDVIGTAANALGEARTNVAPARPLGVAATRASSQIVNLTWNAVNTKVDGTPTYVNLYKVYRTMQPVGTDPATISSGAYSLLGTSNTTAYVDNLGSGEVGALNTGYAMFYTVSAADLCGNEGQRSAAAEVSCQVNATLYPTPANGGSGAGYINIALTVSGTGTYTRARVRIPNLSGVGDAYDQSDLSYPFTFPAWNSSTAGPGTYSILWEVENSQGCVQTLSTRFDVVANLACQITPTNPNLSPTKGKPSDQNRDLSWDIVNNAGKDLEITTINISWSSNIGTHRLTTIEYPTNFVVTNLGGGALTPLLADYSLFPLLLPLTADGMCGTCKVNMELNFDTAIVDAAGAGELVTIRYGFQDVSGATGVCQFTVFPDLTIAGGP